MSIKTRDDAAYAIEEAIDNMSGDLFVTAYNRYCLEDSKDPRYALYKMTDFNSVAADWTPQETAIRTKEFFDPSDRYFILDEDSTAYSSNCAQELVDDENTLILTDFALEELNTLGSNKIANILREYMSSVAEKKWRTAQFRAILDGQLNQDPLVDLWNLAGFGPHIFPMDRLPDECSDPNELFYLWRRTDFNAHDDWFSVDSFNSFDSFDLIWDSSSPYDPDALAEWLANRPSEYLKLLADIYEFPELLSVDEETAE